MVNLPHSTVRESCKHLQFHQAIVPDKDFAWQMYINQGRVFLLEHHCDHWKNDPLRQKKIPWHRNLSRTILQIYLPVLPVSLNRLPYHWRFEMLDQYRVNKHTVSQYPCKKHVALKWMPVAIKTAASLNGWMMGLLRLHSQVLPQP